MSLHAGPLGAVAAICAGAYNGRGVHAPLERQVAVIVVRESREFTQWLETLAPGDRKAVARVLGLLESRGVALGEPHSSAPRGSRYALRELRPRAGASPLRILYAFDPRREPWVSLGGDKAKEADFYRRAIARAEAIWSSHLARPSQVPLP